MFDNSTCRLKYMSTADPFTVAHVKFSIVFLNRASLMPESFVFGRSKTRKAARLAVYEATIIIAKPAHTMPRTRAEKLRGVPSPIPLLSKTPHANQIAELRLRASSSVPSLLVSLKRPKGENLWNEKAQASFYWSTKRLQSKAWWIDESIEGTMTFNCM